MAERRDAADGMRVAVTVRGCNRLLLWSVDPERSKSGASDGSGGGPPLVARHTRLIFVVTVE
jgi:hypothetical protein